MKYTSGYDAQVSVPILLRCMLESCMYVCMYVCVHVRSMYV